MSNTTPEERNPASWLAWLAAVCIDNVDDRATLKLAVAELPGCIAYQTTMIASISYAELEEPIGVELQRELRELKCALATAQNKLGIDVPQT